MTIHPFESAVPEAALSDPTADVDAIYREHAADVSRWIRRLTGTLEAEDVMHEVFLVVQRRIGEFRGDCALRTWLYAITARVVTARRRKERLRRLLWLRAEPELLQGYEPPVSPHSDLEREQASRIVYRVLDQLSERDRTLLIAFELEGLDADSIAQMLGISTNNVWVSLHRARARFREAFERRFGSAERSNHGQTL